MQAWGRWFSVGCIAMFALACGSKGSDDATGGTGAGGAAEGGASGGSAPIAGSPGAGESSGGSSPEGGSPGAGAGGIIIYPFETDLQTWKVQYTSSGMYGTPPVAAPLIAPADVVMTWTNAEGNPAPGAVKLEIPYATASQYVGVGISLAVGVDLTDKIIQAKVKVLSGLGDPLDLMTNPGGAKLYVKTGTGYVYAAGTFTNVTAVGTWIPITFDLAEPSYVAMSEAATFDPKDVREIGIQLDTSGTTTTAMPAVILVDSVTY